MWVALVAGAGFVVLGGVFLQMGLEQADQLASVLGAFTGLAGLGLSGYSVLLSSRNGRPASADPLTDGERTGHGSTAGAEDAMGAPGVHQIAETAGTGVASQLHGTTREEFLPRAWDHLVASDGTTRRV
ncbi:hypothetical protein ACIBI7_50105, partial [Nonomuraea fuscirosea]|uniref:hypothetical protein n=1 Tax=Nonomuraea fuscirosea TaxID=1291556 RepID=UPI0037BC190C